MISLIPRLRGLSAAQYQDRPVKYSEFLHDVMKDIAVINERIVEYNRLTTHEDQCNSLNQIYLLRQEMNNRYPLDCINYCSDYQRFIHDSLWEQLKNEYQALGITSLHERVLSQNPTVAPAPLSINEIFANMHPARLRRFMRCCWENPASLENKLDYICGLNGGTDRANLIELFRTHRIKVLTAMGNSRNLKIEKEPADGSPPVVLKIDARLNSPKEVEKELRQKGFTHFAQVLGEERQSSMEISVGNKVWTQTATLLLTEFLSQGDLKSQAVARHNQPDAASGVLSSALDYYQQMATILLDLQQKGGAFPDAKNTNWLIDGNHKLKIADTKSLLFTTPPDRLSLNEPKNKWSKFIFSKHLVPPDMVYCGGQQKQEISADALHTYMLGKNLYEYLRNCRTEFLLDYLPKDDLYYNWLCKKGPKHSFCDADFHFPVFNISGGPALKELIQKMVHPDPAKRISLQEALETMNRISAWLGDSQCQRLVGECLVLISDLLFSDVQDDVIMISYLTNQATAVLLPLDSPELLKLKIELTVLLQKMDEVRNLTAADKSAFKNMTIPDRLNFRAKESLSEDTSRITAERKSQLQGIIDPKANATTNDTKASTTNSGDKSSVLGIK